MVVLEGGGMLATGSNQYLQPDYLSPLPTTLDAKKSPLALLAQTCSQIGADSPPSKPLIPPLEKPKKSSSGSSSNSSSNSGSGSAAGSAPPSAASNSPAPDAKSAAPAAAEK
ncbi:Zinc finger protein Noc, partial [Gryllus bimaculatus]